MQAHGKIYVALLSPRQPSGELDLEGFVRQVRFVADVGVTGFAVNGATGEMPAMAETELQSLLESAKAAAPQCELICCVGAASLDGVLARAGIATKAKAAALLLPMPYFFPYSQEDAYAFCATVAENTDLPILLYNLPQFTTGFEVDTVMRLFNRYQQIVGLKDSSGSLDLVRAMTKRKLLRKRYIGNDSALCAALREDVCDGVISGVACVLPALMKSFFQHPPASAEFALSERRMNEFIDHISPLPTPWGLKCASEALGLTRANYSLPLGAERRATLQELTAWFLQSFDSKSEEVPQNQTVGA